MNQSSPFGKKPTPPAPMQAPTPQPSIEPEASAADRIAVTSAVAGGGSLVAKLLLHPLTLIGAGVLMLAALVTPHITVRTARPTVAVTTAPVPDTWTLWEA